MKRLHRLAKEPVLVVLIALTALFTIASPENVKNYWSYVDWRTIVSLAGLVVVTTGAKESGILQKLSKNIVSKANTERDIALLLITLSALISTLLTNDITLLVLVPLTLSIGKIAEINVEKLVIFETLAVNVGSALTPVGNPQNIFLWHRWGISFARFCIEMLPAVAVCFAILILFAFFSFEDLKLRTGEWEREIDRNLAVVSLFFLCFFIVALEAGLEFPAFLIVMVVYSLAFRRVVRKADWCLILIFVLMFIDVGCIAKIGVIREAVSSMNLRDGKTVYLLSAAISQIMSNVPASMFMSHFTSNWKAICYGVNVGGNGLIVASLANIISVRYAGNRILLDFHRYSILYFVVTLFAVLLVLYL